MVIACIERMGKTGFNHSGVPGGCRWTPNTETACVDPSWGWKDVVLGTSKVIDINGKYVTSAFLKGAREALRLAEENDIEYAVLKSWSPSCGSKLTYYGSFSDSLKAGQGVTAAFLESSGIQVLNEDEIDQIVDLL